MWNKAHLGKRDRATPNLGHKEELPGDETPWGYRICKGRQNRPGHDHKRRVAVPGHEHRRTAGRLRRGSERAVPAADQNREGDEKQ